MPEVGSKVDKLANFYTRLGLKVFPKSAIYALAPSYSRWALAYSSTTITLKILLKTKISAFENG